MTKTEVITAALKSFDPENDEIWTNDGLPKVDVLNSMTPDGTDAFNRADIEEAWPGFNREVAIDEYDDEAEDDEDSDDDIDTDELNTSAGSSGDNAEQPADPAFEMSEEEADQLGSILDDDEADCDVNEVAGIVNNLHAAKSGLASLVAGKLLGRLERAEVAAQQIADEAKGKLVEASRLVNAVRNKVQNDGTPSLAECNRVAQERNAKEKERQGGQYPIDKSFAPRRGQGKRPDHNPSAGEKKQLQ